MNPRPHAKTMRRPTFCEEISMKNMLRFSPIFLFALVAILLQADVRGGDKKDKEKKLEDVVVNDALTNGDLRDKSRTQSFCKTYTFKMTEGKRYQLDMKSKDVDSYLRLEDPQGQQVAADDDSGGFPDARITYRAPKTGDYTIICTTFIPNTTGKFTLIVKHLDN
jgi:Bacterial pre-peptidase C-terminal domain